MQSAVDEIARLRGELSAAYAAQISGFYEEERPTFRQGRPTHELEELVTAQDVGNWVEQLQCQDEEDEGNFGR